MARTLICEVVTPERIVYTNEVEMVVAPTIDGEIGILPLHAPLVGALKAGEVRVKFGDTTEWFAIAGGYVQVHEDKVIILADHAVAAGQIDVDRVKQSLALAEARLSEVRSEGGDVDSCEADLKWCQVQLEVGSSHR